MTEAKQAQPFERFTPKMAVQLAAPHTWPAAIMPTFIAIAAAAAAGPISISMACTLLVICVLMQSSVNTFNDYYDFVKGADNVDDGTEESDATLVYNNVNPKSALRLAIGFLVVAFVLGCYAIYVAGWIPLAIACVGALFVVIYSAGKTPVSYLPIGEFVSGFVMGGLIPLACYQVLTGSLNWLVLLWAVPEIVGVGLIMLTNNTCDIEKDLEVGRRTLSCLIGRDKARTLYHAMLASWLCFIAINVAAFFTNGLIVLPFMLLAAIPLLKAMLANPLTSASRVGGMAQICSLNIALGAFYAAAIFASSVQLVI